MAERANIEIAKSNSGIGSPKGIFKFAIWHRITIPIEPKRKRTNQCNGGQRYCNFNKKKKQILGWNSSKEERIGKIVKEANGSWGSSANIEQWITA